MSNNAPSNSDTDSGESSANLSDRSLTWLDAMENIFDTAIDRQAEIDCEIDDMEIEIPLRAGPDANYAKWKVNGTLRVSFDGMRGPLAEWFRSQEMEEMKERLNNQPQDSTQD